MSASAGSPDPVETPSVSPQREAAECEAGLQRVLAYICARRHRRLIASAAILLLIYTVVGFPISIVSPAATGLFIAFIFARGIEIEPELLFLLFSLTRIAPSLLIALLIFMRLRRIYLGYVPPA